MKNKSSPGSVEFSLRAHITLTFPTGKSGRYYVFPNEDVLDAFWDDVDLLGLEDTEAQAYPDHIMGTIGMEINVMSVDEARIISEQFRLLAVKHRLISENVSVSEETIVYEEDPIHLWFELSYAQYLTIPRTVLQSMPQEWQRRFVRCLQELDEAFDWRPDDGQYWVRLKDSRGKFITDPLMDYERGRRKLTPKNEEPCQK